MLFHPGMFMDPLFVPYRQLSDGAAEAAIVDSPAGAPLRIFLTGTTLEGDVVERGVLLPLGGPSASAAQRLADAGIGTERTAEGFIVTGVDFGSRAAKLGIEQGFRITAVEVPSDRPAREWMFLPALALIAWVARRQVRRRDAAAATA